MTRPEPFIAAFFFAVVIAAVGALATLAVGAPWFQSGPQDHTSSEPQNPTEWKRAVDVAEVLLLLTEAERYELVDDQGRTDAKRCRKILQRGRLEGFRPRVGWEIGSY